VRDNELELILRVMTEKQDFVQIENTFQQLTKGITQMLASVGISFSFKQIFGQMQEVATKYEQGMKYIWTITDLTEDELKGVEERLKQIASTGVASFEELAGAMYQAISSGMDLSMALATLERASQLATSTGANLVDTITLLASIMNAYKLTADELTQVMDKLFKATELGVTTIPELASVLGRIIPLASQAGVSIDELLSAIVGF